LSEHRSAVISLSVGLSVAGISGLLAYWVATAVAHPRSALPWTEISFVCLGISVVAMLTLPAVLEHVRRLSKHLHKLNLDLALLLRDGGAIVTDSVGAADSELEDLTGRVENWWMLCQIWLAEEFPALEPVFFSPADGTIAGLPDDMDEAADEEDVRAWMLPPLTRLNEIRMKLPVEPSSPYKFQRDRDRQFRAKWLGGQ
jgi:hypothetical protein